MFVMSHEVPQLKERFRLGSAGQPRRISTLQAARMRAAICGSREMTTAPGCRDADPGCALAMSIEKELAASNTRVEIRPHAIDSQSEARDLLVGKGTQGGPLVFPNDTRIAQDSLFRVTYRTRSNRKESGISFPFRQA
jgi:hypothetical protein